MADGSQAPILVSAYPHPLRSDCLQAQVAPGLTLAEIIGPAAAPTVEAWVGAVLVPRDYWCRVRPKAGAIVTLRMLPAGSGGGSKLLRTVLSAVLSIYTLGLAQAGNIVAAAALQVGGSLALNALIPPPKPELGRDPSSFNRLKSITGTQNQASPYGVVPRLYGRHRIFPPFAAKPFTEVIGNDQYLRVLFCLGYGPLTVTDIRIGETPVAQFQAADVEVGETVSGFSDAITEENLSVAINNDGQLEQRSSAVGARELSLDLVFPEGLMSLEGKKQRERQTRVGFRLEFRLAGTLPWLNVSAASGLQVSRNYFDGERYYVEDRTYDALRASVRWATPAAGQYEVRVTREVSEYYTLVSFNPPTLGWVAQNNELHRDDATLTALRSVASRSLPPLPGLVYLALRIKATDQLSGITDRVNCIAQSQLRVWNGSSFSVEASANPAWIFLDIATGSATERALSTNRFQLNALKAWADECSATGRNYGGVIDGRTTVFELMRDVAAVGRASYTNVDGLHSVVRDLAGQQPVQVITPRNSNGMSGKLSFPDLPHALRVRFVNPALGWAQDEIVAYDDGYDATSATRYELLDLRGVTDAQQAWGEGRYQLAALRRRAESITVEMDVESLVCQRGDLVRFSDEVISVGLSFGRLKTVAGSALTLDEAVTMAAGGIYGLRIRKADGSSVTQGVITAAGESNALTMTGTLAGIAAGDLFVFGLLAQESIAAKVTRIEPGNDLSARVTLVPEAPEVQTADEGFGLESGLTAGLESQPFAPRVYHQRSDEEVMTEASDGGLTARIVLYYGFRSGTRPMAAIVEGQLRYADGGEWLGVPSVPANAGQISYQPVTEGLSYDVRLRALTREGVASEWTTLSALLVTGKLTPPPDVTGLLISQSDIRWDYPDPPRDHAGFLLRHQAGQNTAWESAIPAHAGVWSAPPFPLDALPQGARTILVKAVDTAGIESNKAAVAFAELGDPLFENLVFSQNYGAMGYPGTLTGGAVVGQTIQANTLGVFWQGDDTTLFWQGSSAAVFWDAEYDQIIYSFSVTPDADLVGDQSTLAVDAVVIGQGYSLEFRTLGDAGFWAADDSLQFWGAGAASFWDEAAGDWKPWPGELTRSARQQYEFRLSVSGGFPQGVVQSVTVTIDVPDIIERFDDLILPAAGSRLPIARSYRAIANVSLTLQDDGGGARSIKTIDKDATLGPLIRAFDAAGAPTTAKIDATIQGY